MKHLATIAGLVLGLMFTAFSLLFLLDAVPEQPPPPAGSPPAMFMAAFVPTGYMTFVKLLELAGGVLVALPLTRNVGLLILGPIIVNILAFHLFVADGHGLGDPVLLLICGLAGLLLWCERGAFQNLVTRRSAAKHATT